ncbi:MAG TPA: hypothetical protein DDZ40_12875, partial [Deltaproteobacteria bacterium]|nr:hypothetical protein [Deltaproteobacteria bacterium]
MKNKYVAIMAGVVFVLFTVGIAGAQTFAQQVLLPGTLIPKFVDPLPVAGDISVINAGAVPLFGIPGTPSY